MIQMIRLIGKESNNIVLKYICVNPFLPGFFRPYIFRASPLPVIFKTGDCIFMQLDRHIVHLFANIFPEKIILVELPWHWYCHNTKGNILENEVITKYDFND